MLQVAAVACLLIAVAAHAQVNFGTVSRPVVEKRLGMYAGPDATRAATLKQMFLDAGCPAADLQEQPVPDEKLPNIVCVLRGTTDTTVIVGAHYDHAELGSGVVDNWSGASMLSSLMQGLRTDKRTKTFVFVAFAGEEQGLHGSIAYAAKMTAADVAHTEAMVNLDTLGLGPTLVWKSQSDPVQLSLLAQVAKTRGLPVAGLNLENAGISDEESFIERKVCALAVHSITEGTWKILHSSADQLKAIKLDDYYATYRLMEAYLAVLDSVRLPPHACSAVPAAGFRATRPSTTARPRF